MNVTKYLRKTSFFVDSGRLKFFAVFFFALILRAVPEFLSGMYPVGFDALAGYIPAVLALPDNAPMKLFGWAYSPLTVYLLWVVRAVTGVDAYLLLKIMGPIFYGMFIVSFCYMLSHGLGWGDKKSFVVSLIFLLQPGVLRTGWDQLREELGLAFLFVLLGITKLNLIEDAKSKFKAILVLSVLIVLSHQLATILLFVVVFWQLFSVVRKKEKSTFLMGFFVFLPSVLIFVWQIYSQFVSPSLSDHFKPIQLSSGTGSFVFTNYFLSDPRFLDGDYLKVLGYVGSLSLYVVVPLVVFAWRGFFRDRVFAPLLVWLCVASYSIVVFPWFAISYYWWWILLLPIPLTVYLGEGLDKLNVFDTLHSNKGKNIFWVALFMLGLVALGYVASIVRLGNSYAYTYMPPGMVESSVPFGDITDLIAALKWVNENVPYNSTVVVEEKIQGLVYSNLRSDVLIRVSPSLLTLNDVLPLITLVPNGAYAIWYDSNVYYGALSGLKLAEFGRVSVLKIYQQHERIVLDATLLLLLQGVE